MNSDSIILKPQTPEFLERAQEIATRFKAEINTDYNVSENSLFTDAGIVIFVSKERVSVKFSGETKEKPVFVDFVGGKMRHRQKNSGTRKEAIARAVGLKSGQGMRILDATAGLGGDSFILASLGANMTSCERNPITHLLLEDAISRAKCDEKLAEIMGRIDLILVDAIDFLDKNTGGYDVVYIDPMFPDKTKSALNKKEMRLFRKIVGDDSDADTLFKSALKVAKKRVVVKRPLRAPDVSNIKPDFKIEGKSSRFDVYMV